MDELLALLGQHWRLVLLYPGGLSALGALIAVFALSPARTLHMPRQTASALMSATIWLLIITLLPLPRASWPYALDLALLLLALEAPFWLLLHKNPTSGRMAALLNVYPLLALSVAALGQSAGSLVLHDINRSTGLLHWVGIAAWAIALPPLLGMGPWRDAAVDPLAALRRTAHIALLLAAALPAHEPTWRLSALIGFVAILLPLAALDRWWSGDPLRWERRQPWLCVGLALLIAWLSGQLFSTRLG